MLYTCRKPYYTKQVPSSNRCSSRILRIRRQVCKNSRRSSSSNRPITKNRIIIFKVWWRNSPPSNIRRSVVLTLGKNKIIMRFQKVISNRIWSRRVLLTGGIRQMPKWQRLTRSGRNRAMQQCFRITRPRKASAPAATPAQKRKTSISSSTRGKTATRCWTRISARKKREIQLKKWPSKAMRSERLLSCVQTSQNNQYISC